MAEKVARYRPVPQFVIAAGIILVCAFGSLFNRDKILDPWDAYFVEFPANTTGISLATGYIPALIWLIMLAATLLQGQDFDGDDKFKPRLLASEVKRRAVLHDELAKLSGTLVIVLVVWFEALMVPALFIGSSWWYLTLWLIALAVIFYWYAKGRVQARRKADSFHKPKSYDPKKFKWEMFYVDNEDFRVTIGDEREATSMVNYGHWLAKVIVGVVAVVFVWIFVKGFGII
ncbi:Predicted membrane protein [Corynebacterium renale]|uniref:hypothetical protein n=1 Tax=Corynebacterium renale TaxID=1724 RepID=UPI000DA3DCC7|nr:hypothetical protein [Corynebacterium renale]SQG64014.1 Predicted membrane protein [Corynebacterium renale]STD03597.1 Predicted membrane protein [Corynebacterium renale]